MNEIPPTRFAKLGDDRIAYQIVGDGPVDLLWVAGIGDALDARWEYGPYACLLCSPKQAGAYLRLNQGVDIRHVIPSIAVPTLVMHRQDTPPYTRIETSQSLAAQIPGARFVAVPGKGLYLFEKPYAQILDHIEAFVTGISPTADVNRALATILFTDIVGSTEHASALGDRRWRGLLESHDALASSMVDQHGGRLVRHTGDGVLATFDGPGRAIRCAAAFRDALADLGITIRAGLHSGEVEQRGEDIGGIAVHLAARVLEQAGPNEVLTSSAVPLLVAGSRIEFEDRGEYELKGIPGSWRLFAVEV